MGTLDEAIREHLELKRKHGASEDELQRKEEEALGQGGVPLEPVSAPAVPLDQAEAASRDAEPTGPGSETAAVEPVPVEPADEELDVLDAGENGFEPGGPARPEPDELDAELRGAEPAPAVAEPESIEPDEVLPEEALELEPSALPEPLPTEDVGAADSPNDPGPSERPLEEVDPSEDLLEETPEFLEDAPAQDRLWFEQRPPKDFDFDD
jgi:hypothetical protein